MTIIRAGQGTVFHEGERAVQRRAGVEQDAARVGSIITTWISGEYAAFLSSQTLVVMAGRDTRGRVWASPLAGSPGFARALDDHRVLLAGEMPAADPLAAAVKPPGGLIGILAIEPGTRTRIRLNGIGVRTPEGIAVDVSEVSGNCRKYIQRREQEPADQEPGREREPGGGSRPGGRAPRPRGASGPPSTPARPGWSATRTRSSSPVPIRSAARTPRIGAAATQAWALEKRRPAFRLTGGADLKNMLWQPVDTAAGFTDICLLFPQRAWPR